MVFTLDKQGGASSFSIRYYRQLEEACCELLKSCESWLFLFFFFFYSSAYIWNTRWDIIPRAQTAIIDFSFVIFFFKWLALPWIKGGTIQTSLTNPSPWFVKTGFGLLAASFIRRALNGRWNLRSHTWTKESWTRAERAHLQTFC